jgi:hypothetical protein
LPCQLDQLTAQHATAAASLLLALTLLLLGEVLLLLLLRQVPGVPAQQT